MKIYISVDIEGVTGVTAWEETSLGEEEYTWAREQMTRETLAAVEGAILGGAREIYVKDAHDSARNLDLIDFPDEVKIIRDWTGEPVPMLGCLDESFDGVIYIGYHAGAYGEGNPLAHTISNSKLNYIKVNDKYASEFLLNSYRAWELGVPSIFLSGDLEICKEAEAISKGIETVAVKEGLGSASINMAPRLALEKIRDGVERAMQNIGKCKINLPEKFKVEMSYKDHRLVNMVSHYPGVKKLDPKTIGYEADSVLSLMTTRMFIM